MTKKASSFKDRIQLLGAYYTSLVENQEGSLQAVYIISQILDSVFRENRFDLSIEKEAARHRI